jgi:Fe2+ or Zn2+ uptake regulation protein
MDRFIEKCKDYGLKVTPQRIAIYEAVRGAKDHPTADRILGKVRNKYPHLSHDTVNRTLNTFVKMKILHQVGGYGEARRFDPNTEKHHHFRCKRCDTIYDFHSAAFDSLDIPEELKKQFDIRDYKILLEGVCKNCRG